MTTDMARAAGTPPAAIQGSEMTTKVKRRLTSILCADASGYARLMESDETATIGTLRRYREAMDALVARHDGRTVNTWGDAVIAEFGSVVEAVLCAIEIQHELGARNAELPEDQQMRFRIGINLGDVMVENDDLYGEGVNIAARLQEMAEPGGIMISGPVYDMVRNKVQVGFDYRGAQPVKNASEPVTSYRVLLDGAAPLEAVPMAAAAAPKPERQTLLDRVLRHFHALPRVLRVFVVVVIFLFFINLFTGFDPAWVKWPAAVLGALILLWFSVWRRQPR